MLGWITRGTEFVAAMMMAAMFATFILQVTVRYTARTEWIAETIPFLDPNAYGWTLEFCLLMWVWIVFWGNAFVVRQRDHVIFDIVYTSVSPQLRKWFAIVAAMAVCVGLLVSVEPTWDKFHILRLKKTPTLSNVFGDWIRVRHIYSIYVAFLVIVALRYAWRTWDIVRNGAESDLHHYDELAGSPDERPGADPR
ncbi:MAG: TRAP transporter small permease subunit [Boseongicola sp. SB0664_bin_43]|uniref:TRAP transporter small permease protein n=1 Tax=Boseongicola sp. SB0664_bin_43 TaxID=2604844 RepID=A0A6B0Y3P1_9RHOB|nr:TRAP transporter small permease subunit [Boseongicola sp. SB0664_bin_43]MYK31993.1 TRAP transporter small permease subunit [Boseongicola sp. SB0670_bin_30]